MRNSMNCTNFKTRVLTFALAIGVLLAASGDVLRAAESGSDSEAGFVSIFNGHNLDGWDAKPESWTVKDGAIISGSKERTWLIWRGGEVRDFELRLKFRYTRGNSGVQVRSEDLGDWQVRGYQVEVAERDVMGLWHHSLMNQDKNRKTLATAGQKVHILPSGKKKIEQVADPAKVQAAYTEKEWNDMTIIGRGDRLIQIINGVVFSDLVDEQKDMSRRSGVIAIQDHGKNCIAEFKDIRLKHLPSSD